MLISDPFIYYSALFILVFYIYFIIFDGEINIAKLNLKYAQPTTAAKAFAEAISTADPADEVATDSLYGT